jgi:tetratricopeptide (TPR) repeat protein
MNEGFVYLDKAVQMHGNSPHIHYLKGIAYSYQNNYLGAYSEFLLALPGYTDNSKIYHKMGVAAEHIGQIDKAVQHLKDAISFQDAEKSSVIELIKILVKYKILTDKDELSDLMKGHDKETVAMALRYYENSVLEDEE